MQYLKNIGNTKIYFYLLMGIFLLDILGGIYLIKQNDSTKGPEITDNFAVQEEKVEVKSNIKVDLKGEVINPGVYELKEGSILNDLINKANGLKKTINSENISLSFLLEDEMLINFSEEKTKTTSNNKSKSTVNSSSPKKQMGETDQVVAPKSNSDNNYTISSSKSDSNNAVPSTEPTLPEEPKIININTATIAELITLNGIGEAKAQAIIAYREEFGLFQAIEDIKKVKGIGEAIYAKIKEFITI